MDFPLSSGFGELGDIDPEYLNETRNRTWSCTKQCFNNGSDCKGVGTKFKSPKDAQDFAEMIPGCIGFSHDTRNHNYFFHHSLDNKINRENEICRVKGARYVKYKWHNLYSVLQ